MRRRRWRCEGHGHARRGSRGEGGRPARRRRGRHVRPVRAQRPRGVDRPVGRPWWHTFRGTTLLYFIFLKKIAELWTMNVKARSLFFIE